MSVSEMNSRERILAAIRHQPVDRVPTDMWAVTEVWQKLRAAYGDNAGFEAALNIDGFGGACAKYVGPAIVHPSELERSDEWGIVNKKIAYATGEYWEQSRYPLGAAATIEDLEAYNWPKVEWYDFEPMKQALIPQHDKKAIQVGYMAAFTYHIYLRGLENALMDPLAEPEFTRHLLKRLCEYFLAHHRRMLETCEGLIDVVQVTDDLGSQNGPLMGLPTWREFYKPYFQQFCDLVHEFGCLVFHHDDGAIRDFIPDLIGCGVDVLNPIQWPCPGMEQTGLKRDFGDKLCFHGGVDNQRIMPFGTVEEVRAEVRHNIDTLASDKTGYILAPCHNLQANTPMENILAMYDEAHKYGKF